MRNKGIASKKIALVNKPFNNFLTASHTVERKYFQQNIELNDSTKFPIHICSPVGNCTPSGAYSSIRGYDCSFWKEMNSQKFNVLDFLWLELTRKCNLQCIHCYADSSSYLPLQQTMRYEGWRNILRDAFVLGCKKVQFTGGEPTLYPYLPQLLDDAQNIGYEFIEIFTNGTLINNRLLRTFREFNVRIAFSIYASQANIHDAITCRKGSFLKTINSIRLAIDYGLSVRVATINMQHNWKNLKDTMVFLEDLGVSSVSSDRVRKIGRGRDFSESKSPLDKFCSICLQNKLYIDSTGQASPCVFAQFHQVGYISEGLQKILESEILMDFRRRALYEAIS